MGLGAGDSEMGSSYSWMGCICGAVFSGIWTWRTRVPRSFLLPPSIQSLPAAAAAADQVFLGGGCSMDVGRDGPSQVSSMNTSAAGSPPAPNKVALITYKRRTGSASRMRYIWLPYVVSYSAAAFETCHLLSYALSVSLCGSLWSSKKVLGLVGSSSDWWRRF
jgi:hypothetical protein